jgi:3-hydroxyisobutyrate dehydrogenase-like beta-hydroxyacid dehydrogenase
MLNAVFYDQGAAMALNIAKAHKSVILQDVNAAAVELVKSKIDGATAAASPAELASEAHTIITMLPSSPHVQEVRRRCSYLL